MRPRSAPLIVGTGTNNTRYDDRRDASSRGHPDAVVGALVVVPYYVRPSEAGIVAHMKAVADASGCRSSSTTSRTAPAGGSVPPSLLELAAYPNIAGVKQAVGALDADTLQLLAEAPSGFAVLGGEDPVLFPIACMGGRARSPRPRTCAPSASSR